MGLFRIRVQAIGPPNEPVELPGQLGWAYWAGSRMGTGAGLLAPSPHRREDAGAHKLGPEKIFEDHQGSSLPAR